MDSGKSELPHRSSSRLTVWVQPMLCRRSRWHYSVYSKSVELIELIMRLRLMHRQCVLLIIVFCKKRFFHVVNWSKKQKKKKREQDYCNDYRKKQKKIAINSIGLLNLDENSISQKQRNPNIFESYDPNMYRNRPIKRKFQISFFFFLKFQILDRFFFQIFKQFKS